MFKTIELLKLSIIIIYFWEIKLIFLRAEKFDKIQQNFRVLNIWDRHCEKNISQSFISLSNFLDIEIRNQSNFEVWFRSQLSIEPSGRRKG